MNCTTSKFKTLCASKDTIKKMKREATDWKRIYANHISGKAFISKIYKEFLQLNKGRNNYKMGKRFEQTFHQKRYMNAQ